MIKIIGICGGSASGKTAVSEKLEKNNPSKIVVISQDSYYNPYSELSLEERKNINYDHPNAFDIELQKENCQSFWKMSHLCRENLLILSNPLVRFCHSNLLFLQF